ncbi:MAG: cytochrome c3 family protein [Chlamydiota bacterium]|nr:cytochrome c3 family protein [Chlamydiota bacterium]
MIKQSMICFLFLSMTSISIYAEDLAQAGSKTKTQSCKPCHSCEMPTAQVPCLTACPYAMSDFHDRQEGPDSVMLDELVNLYNPVSFSHKLHANMSKFSSGCTMCHHYNPQGPILACKKCHEISAKRSDLSKPGLKGAYHRQCLACHREWNRDMSCNVCHTLKTEDQTTDKTDIIGIDHPPIPEPKKVIYHADFEDGETITFYHNEHVGLFELKCVDCHKNESCSKCHETTKKSSDHPKGSQEIHQNCFPCHETDTCNLCHTMEEKAPFNHEKRSGWPLNTIHSSLSCNQCHNNDQKPNQQNISCDQCHSHWNAQTFNHEITGLLLDSIHIDYDCNMCHENRTFPKISCTPCHEEKFYPAKVPGERIEEKSPNKTNKNLVN